MAKDKITATGKLKEIKIKKGGNKIKIDDISLTSSQVDKAKEIIENGGAVNVTIEGIQGSLLENDGKMAAAGDK
jgi:hypothetical protein